VNEFPLVVTAADGGAWRARRQGPHPNAALVELLAADVAMPPGFRAVRGSFRPVGPTERRVDVDQTNESWILGESLVVKWVTEPLVGPHPAPERLRRLDAGGFTATPALRGLVEWQTPEGFWVPVVTAMDLVADATDGWTWCLDEARIAMGVESGAPIAFTGRLGELTAAMHLALADSPPTGLVADHGDYHVGQVLRTPAGELFVIDFDGNPTLTPSERVLHRPAAYDVAGMLVSLENVGHVVQHYAPELSDEVVIAWTQQVQEEFLAAYRDTAAALLDERLLASYVLDQIHRELAYADSHLPRWRYVPEAALRRRGM
jgi:maltokinase